MTLPRTFRSDQREGAVGPVRPALDQAEGGLVRGAREKVLAREALRVRQSQRKLTRNIHGYRSGSPRMAGGANPTGPEAGSPVKSGLSRYRRSAKRTSKPIMAASRTS